MNVIAIAATINGGCSRRSDRKSSHSSRGYRMRQQRRISSSSHVTKDGLVLLFLLLAGFLAREEASFVDRTQS